MNRTLSVVGRLELGDVEVCTEGEATDEAGRMC